MVGTTPRTTNRVLGGNCASRGLRFASAILAAAWTQRGRCGDALRGPRESFARPFGARRDADSRSCGRRARRGRCLGRGGSLGSLGSLVSIGSKAGIAAKRETKHRGKTANPSIAAKRGQSAAVRESTAAKRAALGSAKRSGDRSPHSDRYAARLRLGAYSPFSGQRHDARARRVRWARHFASSKRGGSELRRVAPVARRIGRRW